MTDPIDFELNAQRLRLLTVRVNDDNGHVGDLRDTTAQDIARALETNPTVMGAVGISVMVSGMKGDSAMLQELHAMVAELCVKPGDDPAEVPCDLWRLTEHIERLQRDLLELASSWDLVGRSAREGWSEARLTRTDAARDRVLYPNKKPTHVQLPLPENKK